MSSTKVKTTYTETGEYNLPVTKTLFCHHYNGTDVVMFYDQKGDVQPMIFPGDSGLWDAMNTLIFPWTDNSCKELKLGVETYINII
jgi:hypothetical protein